MTGYINEFDEDKNQNKNKNKITMSLKVKDKQLLKNYNNIWFWQQTYSWRWW